MLQLAGQLGAPPFGVERDHGVAQDAARGLGILGQRAEPGEGRVEIALPARQLNRAEADERAIRMLGHRGQHAGRAGKVSGRQLLGHEVQPRCLGRGVELERSLEVGQRAAPIRDAPPRFTSIDVRQRVRRLQLHELFGRLQAIAVPPSRVVPRRQLSPAENEVRVLGYQLSHDGNGLGAIAAAVLDPGHSAAQFDWQWVEVGRFARDDRLVVTAGERELLGLAVVARHELRVRLDAGIGGTQPLARLGVLSLARIDPEDRYPRVERPAGLPGVAEHALRPFLQLGGFQLVERGLDRIRRLARSFAHLGERPDRAVGVLHPTGELNLLHRDFRPGGVLLQHGQHLPRLANLVVRQAGVEQHRGGVRVTGANLERLAQVGLAAVAVAGLQLRLAAHHQRDRVARLEPDEFGRSFEVILRAAGLVVPLGQLVPAPEVRGIDGDERLHGRDGAA